MIYESYIPSPLLRDFIKSYWLIDSLGDVSSHEEKVVPDGYPEIIFHYKKPYYIKIDKEWQLQEENLIAGQMRNHFYLRKEGDVGMFGITFQPWAISVLFNYSMNEYVDCVIGIKNEILQFFEPVLQLINSKKSNEELVQKVDNFLYTQLKGKSVLDVEEIDAVKYMIANNGEKSIKQVCEEFNLNERYLERYFKKHIGLSPKFYSRILRFSNIFRLVNENPNWMDVVYLGGFYDQSHFIKNFKEFTGEEPSNYGFNKENMANFFLK